MIPNDDNLAIRKAFGFTLVDLQANQRGELSPRQQGFMKELHPPPYVWFWWLTGIAMMVFIIGLPAGLFPTEQFQLRVITRLPIIITGVIVSLYMLRLNNPLKTRKIHIAEGIAALKAGFKRSKNFYTLLINKKQFRLILPEEYKIIQPGARYRVYFIDTIPPIILSLEQI